MPCSEQYIKIRDGASLSSTLLAELRGGSNLNLPFNVRSSGAQLLLEFYAGTEFTKINSTTTTTTPYSNSGAGVVNLACTGGFLANVAQVGMFYSRHCMHGQHFNFFAILAKNNASNTIVLSATTMSAKSRTVFHKSKIRFKFTAAHLSAVVFASIIIVISALLGKFFIIFNKSILE